MTRINTNINSLTAQQNLAKTGVLLQTALTRLSTGLRINSGKDDPAGMIAAAQLGSDIAGTNAAIGNSKNAEQILDTADSALGQITSLVNDVRTLVTQAANSAAMSPDQIAANQQQIDSSLDAIDRIAQSTNFQGRKLLDGSLDFTTSHDLNDTVSHFSAVQNLQVDSANYGTAANLPVTVSVAQQATKAYLATSTPTTVSNAGSTTIGLTNGHFDITPPTGSAYDFSNMTVKFASRSDSGVYAAPTANYVTGSKILTINVSDAGNSSLTDMTNALAATTINGTGTTVNFAVSNASSAGTVFDITKDAPSNVAAVASQGYINLKSGAAIQVTAKTAGAAGNIHVALMDTAATLTSAQVVLGVNNSPTLVVHVASGTVGGVNQSSATAIAAAITNQTAYTGTVSAAGNYTSGATNDASVAASYDRTGGTALAGTTPLELLLTAKAPGLQGHNIGSAVTVTHTGDVAPTITYDGTTGALSVSVSNQWTGTVQNLLDAINNATGATVVASSANTAGATIASLGLTAAAADNHALVNDTQTGNSVTLTTGGTNAKAGVTTLLNTGSTGLAEDVSFMLTGNAGSHKFDFTANTALTQVRDQINTWSDGTGVTARTTTDATNTYLVLESSDWGSAGTERIDVLSGGSTFKSNMKNSTGTAAMNSSGTDIQAKVNGQSATGNGNTLSIDTPALAMTMTVNAPTTTTPTPSTISFSVTGGGAHFQIGPDVVSTQQANIGIQSVDTANMNTIYGRLSELHSGQDADLSSAANTTLGGKIITAVAGKISTLRGRLGAFSKTTLDTNIATLGSTVNALTNAQSTIQDADFAAETANLTRAQVLTQSGTAVLQIANRGPQNVLALLQNL